MPVINTTKGDSVSLYEKSLLVDLKLEASRGNVYCHQLFFAARVPVVWRLLQEIAKYQYCGRKPGRDLICIQLPDVEYKELQKFTRSLYSAETCRAAGTALRGKLEGILLVLQQRALLHRSQIRIEKLSFEEEQRIQRLILEQLRLGHLSEKRGNVRELGRRPPGHDSPHQRILHAITPPGNADSCATPTAALLKRHPPYQGSVRPKSGQKIVGGQLELLAQTMNVTDHPVSGLAQCSAKDGSRPNISNCNSVEDNLDTHAVQSQNCKIPCKGSITFTKRSPQDDTSPGAPLSSQESPVFNVCMIKELQTSPMQVSGESLQGRLRDRKEISPQGSLRSSCSETTPIVDWISPLVAQ
ncbi:hypothetical protein GWK47_046800 [Chionoecetes opilio]|uniref:BTB domain-containing protein n=1 Tax=Chionoecetes opilio TaxID=41210 RepID=A0A8J4Y590_CHIOP|nr:hypothetical protein GWK47_046800 [Chionoecetes opilio]